MTGRQYIFIGGLLWVAACGKVSAPPLSASQIRTKLITSYFTSPIRTQGGINGFWFVNSDDFRAYIEKKHLSDYQPQPNELPAAQIRNNLKESHYYLRIDGENCDELFFMDAGDYTANAGILRRMEPAGNQSVFQTLFFRRGRDGSITHEKALLTYYQSRDALRLQFPGYALRFSREKRMPAELADQYGKPATASGLAEY